MSVDKADSDINRLCAVYPGTFDPPTLGHLDVIQRAVQLFPQVIVGVFPNPKKAPLFGVRERVALLRSVTVDLPQVTVKAFDGLLVNFVRREKARVILRGIRAVSDMEYEFQMAMTNRNLAGIETLFLMPGEAYTYLTATLVKEVVHHGGDVSGMVPPAVLAHLKKRMAAPPHRSLSHR